MLAVDVKITAAGNDAGIDEQADPLGRLESQIDVERPDIAVLEGEVDADTDFFDGEAEWSEIAGNVGADFEIKPGLWIGRHLEPHDQFGNINRAKGQMRIKRHFERAAALEREPGQVRPLDAERHGDRGFAVADDFLDEAVALASGKHQRELRELGADGYFQLRSAVGGVEIDRPALILQPRTAGLAQSNDRTWRGKVEANADSR
jgi:hypothetical protein